MPDQPINRETFFQTIKQRRKEAAGGADSWKTHELQRLPRKIIFLLTDILDMCETTQSMPKNLSLGVTKFLSKGKVTD